MPPEDIALQAYLASIVESSDDAIIGKSLDCIVMSWNRSAERMFGYTAAEMIGRPMTQLAVPGQQEDMTWILDRVRNGERIEHYETVRQTKDGRVIFVSLSVSPIRDTAGNIVGASKIARDITERKRALEERLRAEERLRLALEAGRMLAWELDVATGMVECSDSPAGFPTLSSGPYSELTRHFHREDVERVHLALQRALSGEAPYDIEFRLVGPEGTIRWVSDRAIVFLNQTGTPQRVLGVCTDITEQKRSEERNATLLREVQQADESKNKFLAMLAHELRNPLAPLRNSVSLLRMRGGDAAMVAQVRDMMDRQVTHMGRLIDDLLDVSRITRGLVSLNKERIDLAQLARLTVEDHQALFESSGVTLTARVPEIPVWVHGDRTRLTQVLDNLLENGRKFTDKEGEIEVEVYAEHADRCAMLRVRDTGIGVDPEMLPKLFEVFSQADRSLDRSRGGLGLGLALVKRLVQLHDGTVEARSAGLGEGTEFSISLPLEFEPKALSQRSPSSPRGKTRIRVLVVEDNHDSAESLRMLLVTQGYEVTIAYSGTEGVELAQRARPDVVVCDIGLPGMDGYAVAKAIRRDPATAGTRLIAVTGYGQDDDEARAMESGFDTHLVKPADPERLLSLLS
jgi:two-component system, chemotaxis family, CheB/CheR fusion protein